MFLCINCSHKGNLDSFLLQCYDPKTTHRVTLIQIEGDFRKYQRARREEVEALIRADNQSMRSIDQAVALTTQSTINWRGESRLAGTPPIWIKNVNASHLDLFYGAGLVYCDWCGSMCTTGYLSSLLFSNCKRADGQKIAEGSKGRLFRMRKGLHPDSGAATWPDGRASSIRINMRKYHFPQAAVMPRKCIVPQQKVFLPLSAKTPVCVPDALQLHVNGVCNTFINDFQTAIEADYDCKVNFRSRR